MSSKLLFVSVFLMISTLTFSQSENKHSIILSYSGFGNSNLLHTETLEGGASYTGQGFMGIGVNYSLSMSDHFDFETGLEYSSHQIKITPHYIPDGEHLAVEGKLSIIDIPIGLRMVFFKYLFINAGAVFSFDLTQNLEASKQSGLGAYVGIGAQYQFKNNIYTCFNYYLKGRSLIDFTSERYHSKLFETGIKLGAGYSF